MTGTANGTLKVMNSQTILLEDHKIREFLKKKLYKAGISKIEIERASDRLRVIVYTAKPVL